MKSTGSTCGVVCSRGAGEAGGGEARGCTKSIGPTASTRSIAVGAVMDDVQMFSVVLVMPTDDEGVDVFVEV